MTWAGGGGYEGEWKDGKRNGKGTETYSDGTKYKGKWKDDFSTKGEYIWACDKIYDREKFVCHDDLWKKNIIHNSKKITNVFRYHKTSLSSRANVYGYLKNKSDSSKTIYMSWGLYKRYYNGGWEIERIGTAKLYVTNLTPGEKFNYKKFFKDAGLIEQNHADFVKLLEFKVK